MIKYFFIVSLINFLCVEKSYSNFHKMHCDSTKSKSRLISVEDINLKKYSVKNKNSVFIFLDVDCPISQYYTKTLQDTFLRYSGTNILFFTVFPTRYLHIEEISHFNKRYGLTIPSVLDKFQNITKYLNATITPEVVIINKNNEILYSGCIDDCYFALGKRNLNPQKTYLVGKTVKNKIFVPQ